MKRKALLFILATITSASILFTGCSKKEEATPVAEETIEETEATEPEEIEPVKEVEATEPEENTTGQLSGAGEYNAEEEEAFYNDDEVYEDFLNEQEANSDTNTSSSNTGETAGTSGGLTEDELDAYLDSIGSTEIIDMGSGPGSFYNPELGKIDW